MEFRDTLNNYQRFQKDSATWNLVVFMLKEYQEETFYIQCN
jgi:hypothetical protein